LPIFAELLTAIELEIVLDPSLSESQKWETIIEAKDAPILAAAVESKAERLLSLNTKDFTAAVARQSGLIIQTPGEFIQTIREIINREW
jgi:predicted nucleic acid-binding protein